MTYSTLDKVCMGYCTLRFHCYEEMHCPVHVPRAYPYVPNQLHQGQYIRHFTVGEISFHLLGRGLYCIFIPRTEAQDDAGAVDWVELSNGAALRGNRRRRPNFQERLCDPAEHLSAIAVDEADANARSVPTLYLKAYSSVQLSYISLPAVGLPSQKRYLGAPPPKAGFRTLASVWALGRNSDGR